LHTGGGSKRGVNEDQADFPPHLDIMALVVVLPGSPCGPCPPPAGRDAVDMLGDGKVR